MHDETKPDGAEPADAPSAAGEELDPRDRPADPVAPAIAALDERTAALERDVAAIKGRPVAPIAPPAPPAADAAPTAEDDWL